MKLKTQIVAIALALGVSTSLVSSQDRQPRQLPIATPTIEGVWQVTRMGVDCNDPNQTRPPFPALMTFYRDGTLTAYANPPGTGPLDTPEAGVWQREPGPHNYSFHDISYIYDENGAFAGSGVVTANLHLTSASSFEYSATIQFFDADGNLVFSGCGRATGTRFQ
jgi:S-methylmethionine-dependent homocysteine/selenocysteine methylase